MNAYTYATQQVNVSPLQQQTNMGYTRNDLNNITNRATFPHITPQPDMQNMNIMSKPSNIKSRKKKSIALDIIDPVTQKTIGVSNTKSNNTDSNRERPTLYNKSVDNDERHNLTHKHQTEVKAAVTDYRGVVASVAVTHNDKDVRVSQQEKEVEPVKNTDNISITNVEEKPVASGSGHSSQIHPTKSDDKGITTVAEEHTTTNDDEVDQPNMVLNNGDNKAVNNQVQDKTDGVNDAQKENSDYQQPFIYETFYR